MTTPNEPNQEFDVWNPDTWPDETAAFNSELNTETVIPLKPVEIKDFQTLTNQIYQGKYNTGEMGFNEVLRVIYALREQCFADNNTERYTAGVDEVRYAVAKSMGYTHQVFVNRLKAYIKDQDTARAAEAERLSQKSGFKRDGKLNILNILHNAEIAVFTHPKLSKRFKLNTFSCLVEDAETNIPISDVAVLQTTIEIQKMPGCMFGKDLIGDAIRVVSERNQYNPLKAYLSSLAWDGVDRLSKAGATYWGTKTEIENRQVFRWLLGAVARVIEPGVKFDTALVLEGKQGIGKSRSVRALVPDDKYFVDHLPKIGDKEAQIQLRGIWIAEISELSAMRKSEVEDIKQFLSAQEDVYRPTYGKGTVRHPRTAVFIGTTNSSQYLKDDTGNRRFFPTYCHSIDVDAIIRDRDQLWAQALVLYNSGETIYLSDEEAQLHAPLAMEKLEHTVMDDLVQQWLEGARYVAGAGMITDETLGGQPVLGKAGVKWRRNGFKWFDVAQGVGLEVAKVNRPQQMEIGSSLRKMGFESIAKNNVRAWWYVKK